VRLRPEAHWALLWAIRVGLLIGVPLGLIADRQPGASLPGITLGSVVLWRLEAVLLIVSILSVVAFIALISWRGLLIVDVLERRRPDGHRGRTL
jgi:hypothetical protein